jgi:hypothetical protein
LPRAEACEELRGHLAMTEQTESANVVEVALTSAFCDGKDVVGIPEAAAASDGLHAVEAQASGAGGTTSASERSVGGDGVDVADGAAAAVAGEDLVAEIAGVGAEAPLVNAIVAAEGAATPGDDLEVTPAAERQAVGAGGELMP